MGRPSPVPIALVLCDNVYKEPGGKTALVGLFNRIRARKCPTTHTRLCVYASVTEVRKGDKFKLDIIHAETEECVFVAAGPPPEGVPLLGVCDFTFEIGNIVFKEPGLYFIRFWANDEPLLQRPFRIEVAEQEKARKETG